MRCLATVPLSWAARAVARLPQGALLALGRAAAWLAWPLLRSRRRVAAINIALCFPQLDASRQAALVRESLANTVVGALELMRAWCAPSSALAGLASIEGLHHLRDALARGQGVLLMCGHFTHTELAVRLLGEALGRPVRVVVRRHNNACLERWFESARSAVFGPTIGKKDVRALLRSLSEGQPVVYSADQNFTYQNAFVRFFGVPAATLTATTAIRMPVEFARQDLSLALWFVVLAVLGVVLALTAAMWVLAGCAPKDVSEAPAVSEQSGGSTSGSSARVLIPRVSAQSPREA